MVRITRETGGTGEEWGQERMLNGLSLPWVSKQNFLQAAELAAREPVGTVNIWPSQHLFSQKQKPSDK